MRNARNKTRYIDELRMFNVVSARIFSGGEASAIFFAYRTEFITATRLRMIVAKKHML
jgi:hypothetical protein